MLADAQTVIVRTINEFRLSETTTRKLEIESVFDAFGDAQTVRTITQFRLLTN